MTPYERFLASKARSAPKVGRAVELDAIHPGLYEWQARLVRWAINQGKAAFWWDTGTGKSRAAIEWGRLSASRTLILTPLAVAQQFVREAAKIDVEALYVRSQAALDALGGRPGIYVTNFEMVDRFDPSAFEAVVLDESSCLAHIEAKRRKQLTEWARLIHLRLACSATPAPNDVTELCNQADWLGVMPRAEMLAAYFVHDANGWRLKGHAADPMYRWMSTWAVALRKPSDLGYDDTGYNLPPLRIHSELVDAYVEPAQGQLLPALGGVGGRAKIRRQTLAARVERTTELASRSGQWLVWAGLNDEADQLERDIDGAVNVPGSWTPDRKAEALLAFADGDIRVLVTKGKIAGFGLNFQNCHQMAFCGVNDSFQLLYQCIRRCYRYGQVYPVDVHVVVSEVESAIVDNLRRKEVEAAGTTDALVSHMAHLRRDQELCNA